MITIFDPLIVAVPTILDAKLCNYYLKVGTSTVVVETIPEYLDRVISGHRAAGAPVTILLPKEGYTPLSEYVLENFESALANFYARYYTFVGGLENTDFVQINVNTTNSVIGDGYVGSEIQLLNDEDDPGPSKYYGTNETNDKGYHDLPENHPPVTISPESVAIASIDENQVLTINVVEGHQPVTIAPESAAVASIDENQVLTIDVPDSGHPPVTIAPASSGVASIDENQVLTIDPQSLSQVNGLGMSEVVIGDMGLPSEVNSRTVNSLTDHSHTHSLGSLFVKRDGTTRPAVNFGAYYNGYCITDARELCNVGAHIPSSTEWAELFEQLSDGPYIPASTYPGAGGKIKQVGTVNWNSPNVGATNEVDLSLIGGGIRTYAGNMHWYKDYGAYHCGDLTEENALFIEIDRYSADQPFPTLLPIHGAGFDVSPLRFGLSVRLVMDSTNLEEGEYGVYIGNDGTQYKTRCIFGKEWMVENLAETCWRDLTDIREIAPDPDPVGMAEWEANRESAYSFYTNSFVEVPYEEDVIAGDTVYIYDDHNKLGGLQGGDYIKNEFYHLSYEEYTGLGDVATSDVVSGTYVTYGAKYNFYAATDPRDISSDDHWAVPSTNDYITLANYLGAVDGYGDESVAIKLKNIGNTYWDIANGTNTSGFTANGSGWRSAFDLPLGFDLKKKLFIAWTANSNYPGWDGADSFYIGNWTDGEAIVGYTSYERAYGLSIRLLYTGSGTPTTYTGNDGKVYPVVLIGSQYWLACNLNETKYRNGDWITGFDNGVYSSMSDSTWASLATEAMCYYDDDEANGGGETTLDTTLEDLQNQIDAIPIHDPVTIDVNSSSRASIDANQVLTINEDTDVKIAFDFITSDELFFEYCCPQAMVFTSQESEFSDAIISPPLNTNLAQYDRVSITALETGMIILNGHTL